jgi:hypothetical protein
MTRASYKDFVQSSVATAMANNAQPYGRFRALVWENERARDEAQKVMLATSADNFDDAFYNKYFSYCTDVYESKNVAVYSGLATLLQLGCGASINNVAFNGSNTLLGVGNGLLYARLAVAVSAGDTQFTVVTASISQYNTTGLTLSPGDVIIFTDSTTNPTSTSPVPTAPTNPESCVIASTSISGSNTVCTVTRPLQYARTISTYVVDSGQPTATNLIATGSGSATGYKKVNGAPSYSAPSGIPTMTWQVDYLTGEANFSWQEAMIGSQVSLGSSYTTSLGGSWASSPTYGCVLAKAAWYPSPLFKLNTLASQQYVFSLT